MDIDVKTMLRKLGYTRLMCRFSLTDDDKDKDIDMLMLKTRASNGLKQAGIFTIYDLASKVSCKEDLMELNNIGAGSAVEIMNALYNYQIEKNAARGLKPLSGFVAH